MIYLLAVTILVMFIVSFLFTRDLFSPACIICISYLISIGSGIVNSSIVGWEFIISESTYYICTLGIGIFVLVSLIIHFFNDSRVRKKRKAFSFTSLGKISIDPHILFIFLFFQLITAVLYFYFFYKGVGGFNLGTFVTVMNGYRSKYYYSDTASTIIPGIVNQMLKLSEAISLICIYIFIYNNIYNNKCGIKGLVDKKLLWSAVLYFFVIIFTSGRYSIIIFLFAAIFMWAVFSKLAFEKQIKLKNFFTFLIVIVLILVFFSLSRTLVGRISEKGFLEYISSYMGCNIQALDVFLNDVPNSSKIWGKETFYGLNRILNKFGMREYYTVYGEFCYHQGYGMGNTYTALKSQYFDFGIIGVVILQSIEALIITFLYEKVIQGFNKKVSILVIVYATLMPTILMHSYSETFFSEIISFSFIIMIVCLVILRYALKISNKGFLKYTIRRKL